MRARVIATGLALAVAACTHGTRIPAAHSVAEFEASLESLRVRYQVPGMSGIIDGKNGTVWECAYGMANIATGTAVTDATMFHLASLTKPFAAMIALQLAQEGIIDLDAPAAQYGVRVEGADTVRLWHLLSHTSEATPPGSAYRYNGNRFGLIEGALTQATGKSFAQLYDLRVRRVLGTATPVPNPRATRAYADLGLDASTYARLLARGYAYNKDRGDSLVAYENHFGPAAGLIATPREVVTFSRALDEGTPLTPAMRARMWSPIIAPNGKALPYGLGWFVQKYEGETVLWHYGLWTGASALIIKVPSKRLTFVLLANSPMLSMPFPLGAGDLTKSPFAMLFLSSFVGGPLSVTYP